MTRRVVFLTLFFCCVLYCGCSKPPHIHAGGNYDEVGPSVRLVKLSDTISRSFTQSLHLEAVTGYGFSYPSGARSSYFSYQVDQDAVLMALARLPFSMRDPRSDVAYREVSPEEWIALRHTVAAYELSEASFFWDLGPQDFLMYASNKHEQHLLLVEKGGKRVYHRIASRG